MEYEAKAVFSAFSPPKITNDNSASVFTLDFYTIQIYTVTLLRSLIMIHNYCKLQYLKVFLVNNGVERVAASDNGGGDEHVGDLAVNRL